MNAQAAHRYYSLNYADRRYTASGRFAFDPNRGSFITKAQVGGISRRLSGIPAGCRGRTRLNGALRRQVDHSSDRNRGWKVWLPRSRFAARVRNIFILELLRI